MQSSLLSLFSKKLQPISVQIFKESFQKKPAETKTAPRGKTSERRSVIFLEKLLGAKQRPPGSPPNVTAPEVISLFQSIVMCFDMGQFVFVSASVYKKSLKCQPATKQEFRSVMINKFPWTKHNHLKRKEKKLFTSADSSEDKFLPWRCNEFLNSQLKFLNCVEFGVLLSDFFHQLGRKKLAFEVPNFFGWRCWYISNSGFKSTTRIQGEKKLSPFFKKNVQNCKSFTHRVVLLLVFCAI